MPRPSETQVFFIYRTAFGNVSIASDGAAVTRVALGEQALGGRRKPDELTNRCANQIVEYLAGKRTVFDLPVLYRGTDFQNAVWDAVRNIPYAQTRTNRDVAEAIGKAGSYRMVGAAVRQNPLAIIVPAHRVVPANGRVDASDPHSRAAAALRALEQAHA